MPSPPPWLELEDAVSSCAEDSLDSSPLDSEDAWLSLLEGEEGLEEELEDGLEGELDELDEELDGELGEELEEGVEGIEGCVGVLELGQPLNRRTARARLKPPSGPATGE